jgi:lysophosphatidate acyltransferase
MPKHASILAKKELKYMPCLGQFMLLSGAIFIDRGNSTQALQSMSNAGQTMKNRGTSIWVFPEGTRSNIKDKTLLPFKKGAFHLAVQSGVPIIPVVCENYWHLYHTGCFESGKLRIRGKHFKFRWQPRADTRLLVLPPVKTEGKTAADVGALAESVREQMVAALRDISRRDDEEIDPSVRKGHAKTGETRDTRPVEATSPPGIVDASIAGTEAAAKQAVESEEDDELVLVGRPGES